MNFNLRRITERDEELVKYLLAQGQATAKQLTERFFPTRGAFFTRIQKLQKMGLIESRLVMDAVKATPSGIFGFMKSMQLRRLHLDKMKIYRVPKAIRKYWPRANGEHADDLMLKHQLLLNNVRTRIEEALAGQKYIILNDTEIQLEEIAAKMYPGQHLVPDLVFRGSGFNIAVELERSVKRETELLLRFARYLDSSFTHIIYYCETDSIHRRVKKIASLYPGIAVTTLWDLNRVLHMKKIMTLVDYLKEDYRGHLIQS